MLTQSMLTVLKYLTNNSHLNCMYISRVHLKLTLPLQPFTKIRKKYLNKIAATFVLKYVNDQLYLHNALK